MATLINGDGNVAVYAAQDADWFAGVEGNVTKILNIGLKMAYEIEDANTIAVKNGVIVTKEGRRIQVDAGSIDEFTIPTGAQGVTKYYIIGYHLYTDASSNQLCETFVQLMANDTDTIPEDTFRGGSDEVYVSLYRVTQDGITLSTVQSLLPEAATIKDIEDDIAGINASLTELLELTTVNINSNITTAIYSNSCVILKDTAANAHLAIVHIAFGVNGSSRYGELFSLPHNLTASAARYALVTNSDGAGKGGWIQANSGAFTLASSEALTAGSTCELKMIIPL